jgi:hypothetical protein
MLLFRFYIRDFYLNGFIDNIDKNGTFKCNMFQN